jgi:hypothetical protein
MSFELVVCSLDEEGVDEFIFAVFMDDLVLDNLTAQQGLACVPEDDVSEGQIVDFGVLFGQ